MEIDPKPTSQPGKKESRSRAEGKSTVGEKSQPITRPASFEYEALAAIQATLFNIVSHQSLPDLLTTLVERAAKLLQASSGGLYLAEPEKRIVRCVVSHNTKLDFRGTVLAYGEGAAGLVAETGQPLKIDNYSTWPGRANIYDQTQPFHALISAPMLWQGKVTGVIHILRTKKFTKNDLDLLTLFASHAAVAVENARLYDSLETELAERKRADENLQQRLNELTAIYENGLVINRLRDPHEIGRQLLETLVQDLFWHHIAIRLKKAGSDELGLIAFHQPGLTDENRAAVAEKFNRLIHNSKQGLSGWAIQTGKIIRTNNVQSHPQYVETYPGIRSGLYVPLMVGDRVIGCISVESEREDVFTEQDEHLLATLAVQAATSLENARLYQDLQQELAERKQAENALSESESLYRRAIEVAGAVPYYQTYTGEGTGLVYEFIGEGIRQITGYGPKEFSAALWDKLILESHLVDELADLNFEDAIQLVRVGEHPIWKCEHRIRARDGSIHWVFESAVELRDENGISHGSIGLFQDITERKRVDEALLENKMRLLESQRVARIGHYVLDIASGTWTSSETIDEIFGIDANYVRDVNGWVNLIHPEHREEMQGYLLQHVLAERQPFDKEYKIIRPSDQTARWVQGIGRLELSKDGQPVRMFGTIQDITERKLIDVAQQAISEKLQTLVQVSPLAIIAIDMNDTVQLWNASAERMFGWSAEEAIGRPIPIVPPNKQDEFSLLSQQVLKGIPITNWETVRQRKDGSLIDVSISTTLLHDDSHNVTGRMSIIADITQRKQTEKLQESIYKIARAPATAQSLNELYAQIHKILLDLLPAQHFYIALYDREKDILSFPYFQDLYDVASPPHKPGRGLTEYVLQTREPLLATAEVMEALIRTGQVELIGADSIEWLGIPLIVHNKAIGVMTVQSYEETVHFSQQDVDVLSYVSTQVASAIERKRSEEALRESEKRFHSLFDNATVGMYRSTPDGRILLANPAAVRMLGFNSINELIQRNLEQEGFGQDTPRSRFLSRIEREGTIIGLESTWIRNDGSTMYVRESATAVRDEQGNILYFDGTFEDITDRKQTEKKLRESEERYRTLFEDSPVRLLEEDFSEAKKYIDGLKEQGITNLREYFQQHPDTARQCVNSIRLVNANKAVLNWYQLDSAEPLKTTLGQLVSKDAHKDIIQEIISLVENGTHYELEVNRSMRSGEPVHLIIAGTVAPGSEHTWERILVSILDITSPKRAEQALRQSEERYRSLFTGMLDGVYRSTHEGRFVDVNPAMVHLFRYANKEEMLALDIKKDLYFAPEDRESLFLDTGQEKVDVFRMRRKDGTEIWVEDHGHYVHDEQGNVIFHEGILRDVTERIRADAEINRLLQESQQRLRQVEALHSIDLAIGSSMDLRTTLNILLSYVRSLLAVDAAYILLFNSASQSFEFAAGHGYRSRTMESAMLPMGHSLAGKVALERRMLQFVEPPDLLTDRDFHNTWRNEGFASYTGIPLIAKGELKGVLEVYHRTSFQPDSQWLDLLQNFSTQAAIALDNAQLFNDLQRSNFELSLAYDATIEGWSRALELRDYETSGHAQRITEWTLALAHAMGMRDNDMIHIRRGALLHDIGKMGIPDSILLKPGPLTEEEQQVIRQHPVYAYEMLSSISYLKSALEIPYCHHEKWDGTGYPRGLKGEEIPPAARVFAVLDVFDSLTTDRSYRKAWPTEKAIEYIRSVSGTHLDPKVVNVFLTMFVDGEFLR